jgi:hypothetical protein
MRRALGGPQRSSGEAAYRRAMPDDVPLLADAHRPAASDPLCARQVGVRYLDLRARGLAHEAAVREAAALLCALRPSLSPRQAEAMAADMAAAAAS